MALDPSIPLSGMNALSTLPTPTQNATAALGLQNQVQQYQANKLSLAQAQREQISQQAISQAYQQNIDPSTGLIDSVGLANTIRNNPNITVGADTAIKNATDQHIAQLNMSNDQMLVAQKAATIQANSANAVVAQADKAGRPISQEDVINEAANAFNGGAWGDPKTDAAQAGMSKWIRSAPTDPVQLDAWMRRQAANGNDAAAGLTRAITGTAGTASLPQGVLPTVTNLNTGQTRASGPIMAAGLAPAQALGQVATKDPVTGQDRTQTAGSQLVGQGVPGSAITGATGPGGNAPPAPVFGGGNGSYPSPFAGAGASAAPAAPPASPYGGAVPTAPTPGRTAQMATGVSQYAADQQAIPAEKASLNSALLAYNGLVKEGPTGTGPGTPALQTLKGYLATVTRNPQLLQSNANYDDLTKLLANNTAQQAAAYGPHTDAGLANAFSGNASTSISNLAAQDVMRTQIALQRARQLSALSYPGSPEAQGDTTGINYTAHAAQMATSIDPRATGYDMMTGTERQKLKDSMSATQYDAFKKQVALAVKVGLVPPPGQQAATGFAPGQ